MTAFSVPGHIAKFLSMRLLLVNGCCFVPSGDCFSFTLLLVGLSAAHGDRHLSTVTCFGHIRSDAARFDSILFRAALRCFVSTIMDTNIVEVQKGIVDSLS